MPEVTLRLRPPIAAIPPRWLSQEAAVASTGELGFFASANLDEIRKHGLVLTPGRCCGSAVEVDDGEPFAVRSPELAETPEKHFANGVALHEQIQSAMASLSHE